jgi:hypothetical protein
MRYRLRTLLIAMLIVPAAYVAFWIVCYVAAMAVPTYRLTREAIWPMPAEPTE